MSRLSNKALRNRVMLTPPRLPENILLRLSISHFSIHLSAFKTIVFSLRSLLA